MSKNEDDLPLTPDEARSVLSKEEPVVEPIKKKGKPKGASIAKPKSPPIDKTKPKDPRGGKRERAGREEGSTNHKYTVRAAISKKYGNTGNWIDLLLNRIDSIEDAKDQVKEMLKLMPYLPDLVEKEEVQSRDITIIHEFPDLSMIKPYADPRLTHKKEDDTDDSKKDSQAKT